MIPFQERKKLRKILYSKASLVVLAVIFFATARGAWNIYQKAQIAVSERDIASRTLLELESRNAELMASVAHFKNEQGIEEEVRQKYTVARSGEEVVVVVDDSAKKGKNGAVVEEKSFWQRFTSFFMEK